MRHSLFQSLQAIVVTTCVTSVAGAAAAQGGIKFEPLAPKNSLVVFWAQDLADTAARFGESGPGAILKAPELEPVVAPLKDAASKERAKQLQELGVDVDEVPWPGACGGAIVVEHDEELDAPSLGVVFWADYGSRAEAARKLASGVLKGMEREFGNAFEEVEVQGGHKATKVEFPSEESSNNPQAPQPPRRRPRGPVDELGQFAAMPESFYFLEVEGQCFVASSVPLLEEAIAASTGKGAEGIAGSADWRGVTGMLGEQDVGAVLMIQPLKTLMAPMFVGPMAAAGNVLGGLFGDVRAIALGVKGPHGESLLSASAAVYVPGEKSGVWEILSHSTPIEDPPAMIGDHAVTFQRVNVRFSQIMKMIGGIVDSLSGPEADAIAPMLDQFGPSLDKAFTSMGPAVWSVSHAPMGADAEGRGVTAIACSSEESANAALATILPTAGMTPRDFKGQVVYGSDQADLEIGLGGGGVIVGTAASVEQALRSSTDPAAKSLSEDTLFRRCAAGIGTGPVVGWGYSDIPELIDQNRKLMVAAASEELPGELFIDIGGDGPLQAAIPAELDPKMIDALEKVDQSVLVRFFGPLVWQLRSDEKGLAFNGVWLKPSTGEKVD